jgi:hypothetical protein
MINLKGAMIMKRTILFGFLMAVAITLAPLAAMAPAAEAGSSYTSGQKCVYHTVRPGQTLSGIASYYGVNMWTIAQRNGITNPNRIYAGQTLLIYCYTPKPPPPPPPPKPVPPVYPAPPCTPPVCPGHPGGGYVPPPATPGDGAAAACSIVPQLGFGNVWFSNANVRNALGCPTTTEQGFSGSQQAFYSGFVVANDTTGIIYVMYNNGTWQQFQNTWVPGEPVYNPGLVPPPGWCQPEYGIGKVWRNETSVSQRLGWAKAPAQMTSGTSQQYQGGMMLWTSTTGVWVLYNNGTFQRF